MSSREGGQGRGGTGHTARSLLPTPVNTRPPRLHVAEPLLRRINTTKHQNTTQHFNNHSTNNHNTRPTYNHTKNTSFSIQLRKINPNKTTEKQKIFETPFKDLGVPLTKLSKNNSGYYAITDEAAAVDKLTPLKATELFKKINLKPIILPYLRAKRTIFIRQLDSSIGKLTPEEITREIKTQHLWEKILEKNENKKNETDKNNRTYLDITKTAIQQTNQPTPALILSSNTHIKLAALVIEAHIASLARTENYGTILSNSLKRNFNIDTSFPDRDSQKLFNLFINPTPNLEPAPIATPNTNTGTTSTYHDMESESEQSSTETNDTQDQNSDNTEPEQPWETRPKKKTTKKKKKACSPSDKHPSPDI
ncbi:hypothetical protein FHG87_003893 [Trinorchestia longiramus]|nr:hypothetical protein FHG87_003893 [Trinorchestia longiramus]